MQMADTDTDEMVAAAIVLAKQAQGISSATVDGQTTQLRDPNDALAATERRRNRRDGSNPTLVSMDISGSL